MRHSCGAKYIPKQDAFSGTTCAGTDLIELDQYPCAGCRNKLQHTTNVTPPVGPRVRGLHGSSVRATILQGNVTSAGSAAPAKGWAAPAFFVFSRFTDASPRLLCRSRSGVESPPYTRAAARPKTLNPATALRQHKTARTTVPESPRIRVWNRPRNRERDRAGKQAGIGRGSEPDPGRNWPRRRPPDRRLKKELS